MEVTTDSETLEAIRSEIEALGEEEQKRVGQCAGVIRGVIHLVPEGALALALVGAQLAAAEREDLKAERVQ